MTTITISLPESLKQFVDDQTATKGFGNVSEYFRSLLREAKEKEEDRRLETLLLEGLASGDGVAVDKAFWIDLKADAAQMVLARQAEKKPFEGNDQAGSSKRYPCCLYLLSGS